MEHIPTVLGSIVGLASLAYLFGVVIFFGLSYLETRATWDYHPKFAFLEAGALFMTILLLLLVFALPLSKYGLPSDVTFWQFLGALGVSVVVLVALLLIYYFLIPQKDYAWWQIWPWYIFAFISMFLVLTLLVHVTRCIVSQDLVDSFGPTKVAILSVLSIANLLLVSPIWGVMFDGPFLEYDPIELRLDDGSIVKSKLIQDTHNEYICWDERDEMVIYYPKSRASRILVES